MSVPEAARAPHSMAKAAACSGGKRFPVSVSTTMLAHVGPQPELATVAFGYRRLGYLI